MPRVGGFPPPGKGVSPQRFFWRSKTPLLRENLEFILQFVQILACNRFIRGTPRDSKISRAYMTDNLWLGTLLPCLFTTFIASLSALVTVYLTKKVNVIIKKSNTNVFFDREKAKRAVLTVTFLLLLLLLRISIMQNCDEIGRNVTGTRLKSLSTTLNLPEHA